MYMYIYYALPIYFRVESHSIVSCPSCQNKFKTGQNRFLPSYVRVLRGSNRVELQFDDNQHMGNNYISTTKIINDINSQKNGLLHQTWIEIKESCQLYRKRKRHLSWRM
jgi:hypothetical protein